MAFKDFASDARRQAPKNRIGEYVPPAGKPIGGTFIDAQNPESVAKAKGQMIDGEAGVPVGMNVGFGGSSHVSRQKLDDRHCNIIKNVVNQTQSGCGAPATWENCRHHKAQGGRDFCSEYMSLCVKDKCSRARK